MKSILFSALLCVNLQLWGQSPPPVNLPEFLPPSPDVAALMKGGELSSSAHTGTANANIPVYALKIKDFTLPISISYSSNGFKPGEIPSRTGIGWSLNAGGAVSRIQRGKPDDFCTSISPKTVSELLQFDAAAMAYITDIEDQAYYHDAQPDEYRYSVNGISGKFIIKRDNGVLQLPYNNVKITVSRDGTGVEGITITDDKGIKYAFGYSSKFEETIEHNLINNFVQKQEIRTAWVLTKITLPTGEYIDFNYSSINHTAITGLSESATKVYAYNAACGTVPEPACESSIQYTSKENIVKYKSYYLTSIAASTGPGITFGYEDRPDAGGDNRLKTIIVTYNAVNVKSVELEYNNNSTPTTSETNGKFFLKKVIVKDPTGGSAPSQEFVLKYVDNGTPYEYYGGQDHLGFATDGISSTPMPALSEDEEIFAAYITPKHPNGEKSKLGMLQRVTYPTGGYDEFSYEPNMKSTWGNVNKKNLVSARAMGIGHNSGNPGPKYTATFTPTKNQTAELHLNANWLGVPPEYPLPDGDPAPKSAILILKETVSGTPLATKSSFGWAGGAHYVVDGPTTVSLSANVSYTLEVEVRYSDNSQARADVVYDNATGTEWKNIKEELCGLRVRKIVSFDPVSNKTVSKFYKYEKLNDSISVSANKLYYPQYITRNTTVMLCPGVNIEKRCYSKVWSNNSVATTMINDAAGVTYKWVIESDDPEFANGGIEHSFWTQGALVGATVIGSDIPDRPVDMYNYQNGIDTQQIYFNNNKEILKKVNHYYSTDSRIDQMQLLNYIVRRRFTPVITYSPLTESSFEQFDVMQYSVYTSWDHLDSTVVKEYDLANTKVMSSTTSYTYGATANIQPTIVKTKGSDGTELRTEMKYANDYPSVAVCTTMVTRNILQPVLQEESYRGSKLLFKTKTEYKDWFSNTNILAPELIKKQKNAATEETRIRFAQYNTSGTPMVLSKENDVPITYIWDYNGTLPVAEIANATYGSGVAYTSFEADGKGGWTYTGTPVSEGTDPGGNKSYSITSGAITYTGSMTTSAKYTVTYWAKGGTITVNGSSGTTVFTKNGWTLYKHALTYSGSGGITIAGSGYIDELRLHPELATVKTFTYKPETGVTTTGDNNNFLQRYEYDVFSRLLRVRDMDGNILKQLEYAYGESITPCSNTSANWQSTGNYRCAKTNAWGNNNTGVREREERDKNNCSDTYLSTRWVSEGTSSICPTVSNCTAADKRVVEGVCETGCKMLVSSTYNGNLNWTCTFQYVWSDGFKGPEFSEGGIYHCTGANCN